MEAEFDDYDEDDGAWTGLRELAKEHSANVREKKSSKKKDKEKSTASISKNSRLKKHGHKNKYGRKGRKIWRREQKKDERAKTNLPMN